MNSLVKYDAACHALSVAKSVDEVKEVRDQAEAIRAYARQAKNRQLEVDAAEIRLRAERRLGEMIRAQKETVGLNSGTLRRGAKKEPRDSRPTLAEAGIDKKLSSRAQKMAARQFPSQCRKTNCYARSVTRQRFRGLEGRLMASGYYRMHRGWMEARRG